VRFETDIGDQTDGLGNDLFSGTITRFSWTKQRKSQK